MSQICVYSQTTRTKADILLKKEIFFHGDWGIVICLNNPIICFFLIKCQQTLIQTASKAQQTAGLTCAQILC